VWVKWYSACLASPDFKLQYHKKKGREGGSKERRKGGRKEGRKETIKKSKIKVLF
jgi:hypothetical protein